MTSFNLILPELNDFISMLGGAESKGFIISVFTISAALARPFSGKLADHIGRKKVVMMGLLVAVLITLLYPLSMSVFFFLSLRFFHGFSAGFMPTGATALITDLLPEKSRGFGMGVWGTFISLGIGVGQSLSFITVEWFGLDGMFMIASGFSVLSIILFTQVEETLPEPKPFRWSFLKVGWKDILEPAVMPAAVVMFLTATCSGIIFVLSAEISGFLHLDNKGHFFSFYVISTILVRLFTGNLSDKIGRRQTMVIGVSILIVSMLLIGFSNSVYTYTFAAIIFGFATGISSPTLFAWTADLSHPERRGVGAGTMFIALEVGIMVGASSTALFYNNSYDSIPRSFAVGAIFAFVALLYLIYHLMFKKSKY
jgi:MFS family permease